MNDDDRNQCACGAVFFVPNRAKCMECTLSQRDRLRVQAGPTKRKPVDTSGVILNTEMIMRENAGVRRKLYFGERLEQGFRMLHGEPAAYD